MKTRTLVLSLLLLGGLLPMSTGCCAQKSKDVGLQLYSIRQEISKDLDASLKAVQEAGYTFVEAANFNLKKGEFYGMAPQAFVAKLQTYGLEFRSSHINGPDPNVASAEECDAWWDKAIALHKEAGVRYIVQPSMHRSAYDSLPGLLKYCELFDRVGAKCEAQGIAFGYHNHAHEFEVIFEGKPLYDHMLENTKPEHVFFQIDLYWAVKGGADPVAYFAKYPGRFRQWHLKDEKEVGRSGLMNFPAYYAAAAQSGMECGIVEIEAYDLTPFEGIKVSNLFFQDADYVKKSYMPKK